MSDHRWEDGGAGRKPGRWAGAGRQAGGRQHGGMAERGDKLVHMLTHVTKGSATGGFMTGIFTC